MITNIRTYNPREVVTFSKTSAPFGGLSNMAPGYGLFVNEINIQSSEILYQACRFPLYPKIQLAIIKCKNPMEAKKISRKHIQYTRQDWEQVKFKVMRWCLEVKLIQNFESFSNLLLSTNDKTIVEYSKKDAVWGAVYDNSNVLSGINALGRLLMELREKVKTETIHKNSVVYPPTITGFLLFEKSIQEVRNNDYFIEDLDEIYEGVW